MLLHVAGFELRYQLKAPAFWVTSLIFFILTFALVTSDNLQLGWGGQVFRNSPYTIALNCMIMGLWAIFILTTFVANVVVRDEETRFGPIIYSTRLSKFDYLFGRFLGAFGAGCVAFLSVPLAAMIAAAMPWLDPQTVVLSGSTTTSMCTSCCACRLCSSSERHSSHWRRARARCLRPTSARSWSW